MLHNEPLNVCLEARDGILHSLVLGSLLLLLLLERFLLELCCFGNYERGESAMLTRNEHGAQK